MNATGGLEIAMDTSPRPFTVIEFNLTEMQRVSTNIHVATPDFDISHYTGIAVRPNEDSFYADASGVFIRSTKSLFQSPA